MGKDLEFYVDSMLLLRDHAAVVSLEYYKTEQKMKSSRLKFEIVGKRGYISQGRRRLDIRLQQNQGLRPIRMRFQ